MLGIKRTIHETPQEMTVTLTMQAFIEGMVSAFPELLIKRAVETPLPPGMFLHKRTKTSTEDEQESKEILQAGFQRLFGMLLWAARGVFPEALVATSTAGRTMSAPTKESWHALSWHVPFLRSMCPRPALTLSQ